MGPYMVGIGRGGAPGVVYEGNGTINIGQGQYSPDPYNWLVGGLTYPENFQPVNPTVGRTSYNYMLTTARQSGITPIDLSGNDPATNQPYCGTGGLPGITGGLGDCVFENTLPHGIYQANGPLTIDAAGYAFPPNSDYIILVNGDLTINGPIYVPVSTNVTFSVSGNIIIGPNVGEANDTSLKPDIEGFYSADQSFIIQSAAPPGQTCQLSGQPYDKRLNMQGAIITNASLAGGSFQNNRNLCVEDTDCPTFYIQFRLDFLLYSPSFIHHHNSFWQEEAP